MLALALRIFLISDSLVLHVDTLIKYWNATAAVLPRLHFLLSVLSVYGTVCHMTLLTSLVYLHLNAPLNGLIFPGFFVFLSFYDYVSLNQYGVY